MGLGRFRNWLYVRLIPEIDGVHSLACFVLTPYKLYG
jgi:hypothetical protein